MRRNGGNASAILRILDGQGQLTRQQIGDRTGLSRSTVADVVSRLLDAGDLVEGRGPNRGRGRPARLLRRADPEGLLVGLDFGHNHLSVAVASPRGQILHEASEQASVDTDPVPTLELARSVATELLAREGAGLRDVAQVAAGMPGPLDHDGVVQIPSMLGNGQITRPAHVLGEIFDRPVTVVNDTVVGALGEQTEGAAQGVGDVIFVKASHGVGAAVVIGGTVRRGGTGLAGEIGHTRVTGATGRCRCGNVGCLETIAGLDGLVAELPAPYDARSLLAPGDPVVDRVVADAGRAVGATLAPVCNALNPSLVVTGGLLGAVHAEQFTKGVREALDRIAQPTIARALEVVPAALGVRAELVGAVALARRHALSDLG